jgi:hypothetical protein
MAEKELGFSPCGKTPVLYQGLTLVGPQMAEKELGFSPCGKTPVLYQGLTFSRAADG